jgi:uncharacterized protein DUF4238
MEQKFWNYADDTASEALKLLLKGIPKHLLSDELKSAWARFLIGVHTRHPHTLPELKVAAEKLLDRDAEQKYQEIRTSNDPMTLADYIATNDPTTPYRFKLELVMGAIDNEYIGEHIINMHWDVVEISETPRRFLTSDRPVAFYYCKRPDGSITMPVSPTQLFVAVNDKQLLDKARRTKPRKLVDGINQDNVRRARLFVWGMGEPRWQKELISAHMSQQMEKLPLLPLLAQHVAAKQEGS